MPQLLVKEHPGRVEYRDRRGVVTVHFGDHRGAAHRRVSSVLGTVCLVVAGLPQVGATGRVGHRTTSLIAHVVDILPYSVCMSTAVSVPDSMNPDFGGPTHIQEAWRRLAGGAPAAVKALLDVAENSESDTARVMAAKAVLDRVGLGAGPEIVVQTVPAEFDRAASSSEHVPPSVTVQRRLQQLREAARQPFDDDSDVIEATIVE